MSRSVAEFLAMGGYGFFVWSAFGVTAVVLIANIVAARRRYRQAIERVRGRMGAAAGSVQR